jgi:hypothetical protein
LRSLPVLAVGQRVFVNTLGERSGSVALGDVSGKILSAINLLDGTEVEVVAWRPNGRSNTRYRVQSSQGADGWLAAENLRSALAAIAPDEPSTAPTAGDITKSSGRRFGGPA